MFRIRHLTPRAARTMAVAAFATASLIAASESASAQAPDPADVAAGFSIFRSKGSCQSCHGWAADGRKLDNQMPDGANIRESTLDRDAVHTTIQCGRPGSGMPAFDKFAYSDGRCYGMKAADLKAAGQTLNDPPATLTAREIDLVTDFLFAKVIGQGTMDHAKCVAYWGSDNATCKAEFP